MAEIRCSNCGKDNPDFFDNCQFCQTPLQVEATLRTGDVPEEMDTGELEPILPEWLQNARKQNRDSVEDNSVSPETRPRLQKNEPLDLLAGLASQDDSDEDEVPDWLAGINKVENKESISPSADEKKEESTDFFTQFSQAESQSSEPFAQEPVQDDLSPFVRPSEADPGQADELSDWLSQTSPDSSEPITFEQGGSTSVDNSLSDEIGSPESSNPKPVVENESEDLSWLHNLEVEAKKTGDLSTTETGAELDPAPTQSESSQEDPSWLNNLGGTPMPTSGESIPPQSESLQGDLDWMSNLRDSQSNQESAAPFIPGGTAPLGEGTENDDATPDWLKSALDEPSMPAPGDLSMDRFTDQEEKAVKPGSAPDFQADESSAPIQDEPVSSSTGLGFSSSYSSDMSATSSEDVDDMFNVDRSNWGSQETDNVDEASHSEVTVSGDDALDPVNLPSWVQAMRPVDSAFADTDEVNPAEQEAENEGPLAGFQGVIPSAPIGSSLRPKAFSLKLQATDEQQAGASLIEQIIASETAAPTVRATTVVASQRMLRWILSSVFIVVLGLVVGLGWQTFDIVAPGQVEVSQLSTLIGAIPDGSPVLLVMDYEPAVAGELAAVAGPVLDQLALSRHSTFTFLAMSPNGSGLVEHLLSSTKISSSASDNGLEYKSGVQYFNAGYLPGGSAGALGFINDPVKMMPDVLPLVNIGSFSHFEAIVLLTDNAESGRVWVEQLDFAKQTQPELVSKPLIIVSSAQAGPMLQPYTSSGQVDFLINGLSDAAKYEYVNQSRPGLARKYWDSFGIGLMVAVLSITVGSIWNIFIGIRERRDEAEQG